MTAHSLRARIEIFRHLFSAVAEEMGATLRHCAFSPNIKERLDLSCALFDEEGSLLAQAMHIPVHLGAMTMSVRAAIDQIEMAPGDHVLLNDPYAGGSHLPDLTLVHPVYLEAPLRPPELVGYVGNRAHHADIGGMTPGSMPASTSIFQEGLRLPPVRLIRGGELDPDLLRIYLANVRGAPERLGDLRAQQAANRVGARRLLELVDRYSLEELRRVRTALLEHAERAMRQVIQAIPDGEYSFEDALDDDGSDEMPVPIRVTIRVDRSEVLVDFAGTSPMVGGCINAVEAVTLACVHYVFHCLGRGQVPANQGATRPITVRIPQPSLLDATYPAAVVAGNVETSQRVVDVLLGALAQALPDRVPAASSGTMNTVTLGGWDPVRKREFAYVETLGGGMGGRPGSPGLSGVHTHMTNTMNTPVEALEFAYPLRVRSYHLRAGTGGAGAQRGGDGLVREIEALVPCQGSVLSERRRLRPFGLRGGEPGAAGENALRRGGEEREEPVAGKAQLELRPGDAFIVRTPGGGGWGTPDRPPQNSA